MNLSFQKLFYAIATVFALFAILILAKSVLIPLAFALLISFILLPLTKKFESWGVNNIIAVFLSILTLIILISGGIFLFSTQIIKLSEDLTQFKDKLLQVFADATLFFNNNLNVVPDLDKDMIVNRIKEWLGQSVGLLVGQTFSGTASFFTGLLSTIIFTFLILIYRNGLTFAFSRFYPEVKRTAAVKMFRSVQQVGKRYLFGMLIIITILGLANSIGLLIIGIDYPFLFGFLAGILAIIPYIGTVIGATIPILYAFINYESPGMALAVVILFWCVQFIESNFLSPKIVGGGLKINALAAILSIIIGAAVWGVAGMILFLPLAAMLKVVCAEYEELQPIALLIGDHNQKEKSSDEHFVIQWLKQFKAWFIKTFITKQ